MTQTNEELREKIKELFNDHYWDSLSKDRDLILGHCYFIVDEIMSLIQQSEQKECKWKQWSEGDTFDTDCDNCFSLIEGSIEENNFKHCPYCGKLIKVVNEEGKS